MVAAWEMPDVHELLLLILSPQGNQHQGQASEDSKGIKVNQGFLVYQGNRATRVLSAPPGSPASQG